VRSSPVNSRGSLRRVPRRVGQQARAALVEHREGLVHQKAIRNDWLGEIDKIFDWSAISRVLSKIFSSDEGRPSYPVLTLVKLLLLQQWWYCLSDL
jgi:hypothetical protein